MGSPDKLKAHAAQRYADLIVRSANQFYDALYQFARIKGWEELGYPSFGAWADENMPVTRWVAYQELARSRVLGKVAEVLCLPISEVSHAASTLPQGEASALSQAIDDDPSIVDAEIVETQDPVEVVERLRAVVGRKITKDPNRDVMAWAVKCRNLPYPESVSPDLHEVLLEAQDFIKDALASWEEL